MRRNTLLVVGAFALSSLLGVAQTADQAQAPAQQQQDQTTGQQTPAQPTGRRARRAQARQRWIKELNLTPDQQEKIKPIMQKQRDDLQALKSDTSLTRRQKREKRMQIHKDTMDQVRALLTPEQQQKFDQMQAQAKARHARRKAAEGATSGSSK